MQEKRKFIKRKNNECDNIIDFEVQKMWLSMPKRLRDMYLENAFCINCYDEYGNVSFKSGYKIVKNGGLLEIIDECEHCGNEIVQGCIY